MDWWPVQVVPCFSPEDLWRWTLAPHDQDQLGVEHKRMLLLYIQCTYIYLCSQHLGECIEPNIFRFMSGHVLDHSAAIAGFQVEFGKLKSYYHFLLFFFSFLLSCSYKLPVLLPATCTYKIISNLAAVGFPVGNNLTHIRWNTVNFRAISITITSHWHLKRGLLAGLPKSTFVKL